MKPQDVGHDGAPSMACWHFN